MLPETGVLGFTLFVLVDQTMGMYADAPGNNCTCNYEELCTSLGQCRTQPKSPFACNMSDGIAACKSSPWINCHSGRHCDTRCCPPPPPPPPPPPFCTVTNKTELMRKVEEWDSAITAPTPSSSWQPPSFSRFAGVPDLAPYAMKHLKNCGAILEGGFPNPTVNCEGLLPIVNWIVGTCEPVCNPNDISRCLQATNFNISECMQGVECQDPWAQFCTGLVPEVTRDSVKINYLASYQFNSSEFELIDDSSVGDIYSNHIEGRYSNNTGWMRHKKNFKWKGGDWQTKYSPFNVSDALRPPGFMTVLSTENFYYGTLYMLSQMTINGQNVPQDEGVPYGCWCIELDPIEGSGGWGRGNVTTDPKPTPVRNINELFSSMAHGAGTWPTSGASVDNQLWPVWAGNESTPSTPNYQIQGGGASTLFFENGWNVPYIFVFVVDREGMWMYRFRSDSASDIPWEGIARYRAERKVALRPDRPIKSFPNRTNTSTAVPASVDEAVMSIPGLAGVHGCARTQSANYDKDVSFAAQMLGAINLENDLSAGAYFNWWNLFKDTNQSFGGTYSYEQILSRPYQFLPKISDPCLDTDCADTAL